MKKAFYASNNHTLTNIYMQLLNATCSFVIIVIINRIYNNNTTTINSSNKINNHYLKLMIIINKTLILIINKSKYKKVGVLQIRIVQSNVSSIGPSSEKKKQQKKNSHCFLLFFFCLYASHYVNFNNMCFKITFKSNNRSTCPKLHRWRIHRVGAQTLNALNRSKYNIYQQ